MSRVMNVVKTAVQLPARRRGEAAVQLKPKDRLPRQRRRLGHESADARADGVYETAATTSNSNDGANVVVKPTVPLPRPRRSRAPHETRHGIAAAPNSNGDQAHSETRRPPVAGVAAREGHGIAETRSPGADLAALETLIAHFGRSLWDRQGSRVREGNRIAAMGRDGLAADWMEQAAPQLALLESAEKSIGAALVGLVKRHPLAGFVAKAPGLGCGGLGRILAVTGSLDRFATVSKLWAYVGMHVVNGRAPKAEKGKRTNWARQGRVVCHQIGEAIVKLGEGKYREIYDARRVVVLTRPRLGDSGCPFGHDHIGLERKEDAKGWQRKTGKARIVQCVKTVDGKETSAHVHADAMRVAVKELLKDLWIEWRQISAANVGGKKASR